MSENDQGIIHTASISIKEKAMAISMLVAIFLALVVPVSQSARRRELQLQQNQIASQSVLIDEERRLLQSQLTEMSLPEVTLRQSVLQGLSLEKIFFDEAKIVVVQE
ncbi:hypothetical protein [Pleomorphochaeta sp. DL1XJH-081]|jgi:uncharacterized membrane protein YhiD involved in acid resistance|uniref:hypothetical protein n=1 Tax=Pleomorphochaeta sp. DL1XJH-081 TaxID=3409690 RepID=UPI003BB513E1